MDHLWLRVSTFSVGLNGAEHPRGLGLRGHVAWVQRDVLCPAKVTHPCCPDWRLLPTTTAFLPGITGTVFAPGDRHLHHSAWGSFRGVSRV